MELKWKSDLSERELTALSEEALTQIEEKHYDAEMKNDGIDKVLKLGIAFSGKKVIISSVK